MQVCFNFKNQKVDHKCIVLWTLGARILKKLDEKTNSKVKIHAPVLGQNFLKKKKNVWVWECKIFKTNQSFNIGMISVFFSII